MKYRVMCLNTHTYMYICKSFPSVQTYLIADIECSMQKVRACLIVVAIGIINIT